MAAAVPDSIIATSVVTPETPPPAEPQVSLADHEAQYSPDPEVREEQPSEAAALPDDAATVEAKPDRRDARGRYRGKDLATPADTPRIAELTKNWREAQKKIADLEAKLAAPSKVESKPPAPFTEKPPTPEAFANEPDPYKAEMLAQAAFDRRKEAADAQAKQHTEQTQAAEQERIKQIDTFFSEKHTAHLSRMQAYLTTNAEARADFDAAGDDTVTPVMAAAVALMDDDSAKALHTLVKDQALRDELVLQTLGKQITPPLVAIVQRRLKARMEAVSTGSAAPAQRPVMVPRPPNPVRTAPQPPTGTPPGEGASLADHERYWGPKARH